MFVFVDFFISVLSVCFFWFVLFCWFFVLFFLFFLVVSFVFVFVFGVFGFFWCVRRWLR